MKAVLFGILAIAIILDECSPKVEAVELGRRPFDVELPVNDARWHYKQMSQTHLFILKLLGLREDGNTPKRRRVVVALSDS